LEDINEQLREQQRREAEMKASRSAQSGGIGAGISAGADIYKLNTPSIGTQAMQQTLNTLNRIQSAMSNTFSQIIMGTKSVGAAFAEMGADMLSAVVSACTEMIAQWLMTHVIMAAIDKIFGSSLANQNDAKKKKAINADLASSAAALAAANALAYTSALYPPPVPEVLSAMTLAIGEGYAAVASASGGWGEIDRDQMAMVHKKEMILPASIADTVRGLASVAPTFGNGYLPRSGSDELRRRSRGGFGMNNTFHQYGNDPKEVAREVGSVVSAKMQRMMKSKLVRV
jgi:hypothetical protein